MYVCGCVFRCWLLYLAVITLTNSPLYVFIITSSSLALTHHAFGMSNKTYLIAAIKATLYI